MQNVMPPVILALVMKAEEMRMVHSALTAKLEVAIHQGSMTLEQLEDTRELKQQAAMAFEIIALAIQNPPLVEDLGTKIGNALSALSMTESNDQVKVVHSWLQDWVDTHPQYNQIPEELALQA